MENHNLPSTKSKKKFFWKTYDASFFAKTCKTKIKMNSDFFQDLDPPPDQNRDKVLMSSLGTKVLL